MASRHLDYLELSPEQLLSAEVISASKKPEKISETPSAVYVITHEDIQRSGVTTIPDALRLAPGVQVAQVDANSWAISIRGLNSTLANKLLVMIDGRSLYNPLFAGTYWESHDVMLEDIDRIEIVRGPGGTLWGANAVNGVINIITKSAHETQGTLVSALSGNHEKLGVNARHGGKIGTDRSYRIYVKHFDRDNFPLAAGGEAYDAWHSYRTGFRTDWKDALTVQANAYRTHTHQLDRLPLAVPVITPQHLIYKGASIQGHWRKLLSGGGLWSARSYLDYRRRDEPALLEDNRIIFDLESQYDFPLRGRHDLIIGGNYRFIADDEKSAPFVIISPAEGRDHIVGVFLQDEIDLVPEKWSLTLGTKIDHNEYSGWEIQPNARLEWKMDDKQTFWSAVSRAVRSPSRLEQDVTINISPAQSLVPNKNFDSEELIAYEAGYRNQITPRFSVDLAFFYNDYDDLAALNLTPPDLIFTNDMNGNAYGGEIAAEWKIQDDWRLFATYGYLDLSLHAKTLRDFNEAGPEGSSPHHQASFRSWWDMSENWSLNTVAHYAGELETGDIDSYVRVDANVEWRVQDNFKLNLVGQNLLDGEHAEFQGGILNAANVERSIFGKLTWTF